MDPLRIGVVGLGDIAVRAHLPAIASNPRATLVAVCDVDPKRLERLAPRGVRSTTSAEAVVADPAVDAVIVATPPAVTAQLVGAALQAGKYVLAEKPLASSLASAAALRDVDGAGERLQIGLTYRHHPAVERLRELIVGGALGGPLLIQAALCDEPADPEGDPAGYARRLRSLEHLPPVISDGVHLCDRLNYVMGDNAVVDVSGWGLRTDPAFPAANVNGGVLRYGDGSVARVEVVWLTPVLPLSQFVITGSLGRATLDPPTFGLTIDLADGSSERLDPPGDKVATCFARQLERFVSHSLAGTRPTPGLAEALASLALAERIAEAAGVAPAVSR